MPKIKTHSGAKKRFKITKNGKVLHGKTNRRHKLNSAKKSTKRKRNLRKVAITDKTNVAQVKRLLPYK
ncbi:MAG: 50S ribosomal protein L35 [Oscillospiraceae bacterium]|jgi:large subunit ribosomal protein L35|nr:50S ribosomal protein L35 [Clostridia bacterium]MBQ4397943.1 50S ribosomal protein L35 [Clostridia bacterium]MBQ5522426.1 50S ribosomal protein L35 [Oscillospiraceae bacterium]